MFLIEPEVSGGLGDGTLIKNQDGLKSGKALFPVFSKLVFEFTDWLGDDIVSTHPIYLVSLPLAERLSRSAITGSEIVTVDITVSSLFKEINPDSDVPKFRRLLPKGTLVLNEDNSYKQWSGHDICQSQYGDLIVSKTVLELLQKFSLAHCLIEQLSPAENS